MIVLLIMAKFPLFKRSRNLFFLLLASYFLISQSLFGQAPLDEWRSDGNVPMTAQPHLSFGILSNPASIAQDKDQQSFQFSFPLGRLELSSSYALRSFITAPEKLLNRFDGVLSALGNIGNLLDGAVGGSNADSSLPYLQGLDQATFDQIMAGTSLVGRLPSGLTALDLALLSNAETSQISQNIAALSSQIEKALVSAVASQFQRDLLSALGDDIRLGFFAELINIGQAKSQGTFAWAWQLRIGAKALVDTGSFRSSPLKLNVNNIDLQLDLPLLLQVYGEFAGRAAFSYKFDSLLPGMQLGLGFKLIPFIGINQDELFSAAAEGLGSGQLNVDLILQGLISRLWKINAGLDLGLIYNFGGISPALSFLYTGLRISDLLGFTLSLAPGPARYSIDFDWGVYLQHDFGQIVSLSGGIDILQIKGFFESNPYSSLELPFDHFRFLAGVSFFQRRIGLSLQFYRRQFTPSLHFNLRSIELSAAFLLNTDRDIGFKLQVQWRPEKASIN